MVLVQWVESVHKCHLPLKRGQTSGSDLLSWKQDQSGVVMQGSEFRA